LKELRTYFKKGSLVEISDYLDERSVVFLDDAIQTKEEALNCLVDTLNKAYKLHDVEVFRKAIHDRERLSSTGISHGVAIPHTKLSGYEDFFIAVGIKSHQGIEWNSIDKLPVQLVFMIGGPDNAQTKYLKILSCLTAAINDQERRKALLKSTSAQQVIDLFKGC
jgi:PTS system nitrogen regulatory IIA component